LCLVFFLGTRIGLSQSFKPLAIIDPEPTAQNVNWNYNMGYRFTVTAAGNVTHIGGKWRNGITHKVRLFKYPSGVAIDSFDVTGTGDWNYLDITDTALEEDSQYVVCVRLNAQSSGMYSLGNSFPEEHGGILIQGATFIDSTDAMPTNLYVDRSYGFADIIYEPCSYAGVITTETTEILEGEKAVLEVAESTGPIHWQYSSDNENFTRINGAVSSRYESPSLTSDAYYRTVLTSGTCLDTSKVMKIQILDPFYPARILNPRITNQSINWNYNMGYRFTCETSGQVTALGGRWRDGVDHVVRLYDDSSGVILSSALVKGDMAWNYEDIAPVTLEVGKKYVVAVRLDAQASGAYSVHDLPEPSAGITIEEGTYRYNSNLIPTNQVSYILYGMADMRFEPCVFGGYLAATATSVPIYDSTSIHIIDHVGSIIWQQSSDGLSFTTIPGKTDSVLNTGSVSENTYYRTIATNSCGSDTSVALLIERYLPGQLLRSTTPQDVRTNINWNYNMGYRFTPEVDGKMKEVGGNWSDGVQHTVYLFDYTGGGSLIDSFQVMGTGSWTYDTITPINLDSGNTYVLSVRLRANRSGSYGRVRFPQTKSQVIIHGATYVDSTSAMPTNLITAWAYGMPDMFFEPCVYSGELYYGDTLLCAGDSTWLHVKDVIGTLQWQESTDGVSFSNISGATDSVLETGALGANKYYRVLVTGSCGIDSSEVVKVRVLGAGGQHGLWVGLFSNDWAESCNWDDGQVPVAGDSVFIREPLNLPANIPGIDLAYLEIDDPNPLMVMNSVTIREALVMKRGGLQMVGNTLFIADSTEITAQQSLAYIALESGASIQLALDSGGGYFELPIGDRFGYSPVTILLGSATMGTNPSLMLSTTPSQHPSILNPGNFIERYWTFSGVDISAISFNLQLNYDQADVSGGEGQLYLQYYDGSNWNQQNAANSASNLLSTSSALTSFGSFTAFDKESIVSAQSGSWNSTTTWVGGVIPGVTDNALIKLGHTVSLSAASSLGGIEVETGAAFNALNFDLSLSGNLRNEGSLLNLSKLTVSGTGGQVLDVQSTVSLDTLIIDNGDGVQLTSGFLNISGKLQIDNGSFSTNNAVRLLSNSTHTAYLAEVKGSLSGQIAAQRNVFGMAGHVGFRHFSSPIQKSTIGDLMYDGSSNPNGIYMYGFAGSNYPSYSWPNAYTFNESKAGTGSFDDGWTSAVSTSNLIAFNIPYTIYTGGPNYPSYDLELQGYPNVGQKTIQDLSFTSSLGWHMVGNPYPSAIDWSSVSKTNVDATAYVFSETSSGYTASSLLTPAHHIASFQAFFVLVNNASNNITFQESDKVDQDATFQKALVHRDRLRIEMRNVHSGLFSPVAIDWHSDATVDHDSQFDAYKLQNPYNFPNLSMRFKGIADEFQVNAIPLDEATYSVQLLTSSQIPGTFELRFVEFPTDELCLFLEDRQLDTLINVFSDSSYQFTIDSAHLEDRFVLHLANLEHAAETKATSCFGNQDGEIAVELPSTMTSTVKLFNSGNDLVSQILARKGSAVFTDLSAGLYKLKVIPKEFKCMSSRIEVEVFEPQQIVPDFEFAQDGAQVLFSNKTQGSATFRWDFGDGMTSSETHPTHQYRESGNYRVNLIAGEPGCSESYTETLEVSLPSATGLLAKEQGSVEILYRDGYFNLNDPDRRFHELELIDLQGKRLAKSGDRLGDVLQIRAEGLASGMYLLKCSGLEMEVVEVWVP
jgi:hypothetical protein